MARPRLSEEDTELADRRMLVARDLAFQLAVIEAVEAGTELAKSMRDVHRPRYTLAAPGPVEWPGAKPNAASPWRR